jgi:hypothetical protein
MNMGRDDDTQNVCIWILNDEGLYNMARGYDRYLDLVSDLRDMGLTETPDGVRYDSADYDEMNEVLEDL